MSVAVKQSTKKKDELLRKELQNADLERFKKMIRAVFSSPTEEKLIEKKPPHKK